MRFARDGLREMLISTFLFGGGAAIFIWLGWSVYWAWYIPAVPLLAVWIFTLAFFRDPDRAIPTAPGLMVSPADGKVTEVAVVNSHEGIDGPAVKISIFLSVFNVHVNRMPCAGRVLKTDYRAGEFLDARHPECGIRNESNTLVLDPQESALGGKGNGAKNPVIIRQVAGLIARRIICKLRPGDVVARGQRLGMIKFGSRTDLIVAVASGLEPAVKVNDVVYGGETVIMRQAGAPIAAQSGRVAEKQACL